MNDPITETFTGTKRDNFTYVTKISLQMIYQLKYNDLTRKYFSYTRSFTNPNYSFSVPYSWLPTADMFSVQSISCGKSSVLFYLYVAILSLYFVILLY